MIWQHWYCPELQQTMVSVAGVWTRHVAGKGTSEIVTEQRYSSPECQQGVGSGGQTGKKSPPCSYNFFR